MWDYFWAFCFGPLIYEPVFMSVPNCCDYCSFNKVWNQEVWCLQLSSSLSRLLWLFGVKYSIFKNAKYRVEMESKKRDYSDAWERRRAHAAVSGNPCEQSKCIHAQRAAASVITWEQSATVGVMPPSREPADGFFSKRTLQETTMKPTLRTPSQPGVCLGSVPLWKAVPVKMAHRSRIPCAKGNPAQLVLAMTTTSKHCQGLGTFWGLWGYESSQ